MMGQPIVTYRAVIALHIGVLLRLSRLDESTRMPRFTAHAKVTALLYSGTLSQRMTSGLPRHSIILLSDQITRSQGSEKSTSMPIPSRL